MMDERQMRATWLREQRYNRDRGLPHYTILRDPQSGAVVADIDRE